MSITQAILVGLIAFAAYMGDTLGYSQYDRPICTGTLVGLVLGDLQQGLIIGASLELIYMGMLTIGGAFPPDIYTGGILGTAFAITTGSGIEGAIALSLPIATFALFIKQFIYTFVRGYFVHRADSYADDGDPDGVSRMHVIAIFAYSVPMAIIVGLCFYAGGPAIQSILDVIPEWIMNGLAVAAGLLPALGFAMLAKLTMSKKVAPYFFAGFLLAGYLNIPIIGLACFGLIVAFLVVTKGQDKNDDNKLEEANNNEF